MKKVLLYGGAFDPVTLAHIDVVKFLGTRLAYDEVWVIPSENHPFGKNMASFDDRVKMCEIAFGNIFGDADFQRRVLIKKFRASDAGGFPISKTIDLLRWLKQTDTENLYSIAIGSDEARKIHTWYEWETLIDDYKFVVVERWPDAKMMRPLEVKYWRLEHTYLQPEKPFPFICSSDVRRNFVYVWRMLNKARSKQKADCIYETEMSGLITKPVFDYIIENGLYVK